MDISEITNAIISGKLSNRELSACVNAIKFARTNLSVANKAKFPVGASVKFDGSSIGKGTITGKVAKTGKVYFKVESDNSIYKVPANMLEKAE